MTTQLVGKYLDQSFMRSDLPSAAISAATTTASALPATAAAASTTASTAVEAAASAAGAFGLRTSFVHVERARSKLHSVAASDGFFGFFVVRHLDKAEAARLAGVAVFEDGNVVHLAVSRKGLSQLVFGDVEIQIADVNVFHISSSADRSCSIRSLKPWLRVVSSTKTTLQEL